MASLALDRTTNDLFVDSNGNIAVVTAPYAVAQDVATAVRTNLGECWYSTLKGIDYSKILGAQSPLSYIKQQLVNAALGVPGVVSAVCFLTVAGPRKISGQIQVTTDAGITLPVSF